MSRVADALRKAAGRDPAVELFHKADRAEGDGLWGFDQLELPTSRDAVPFDAERVPVPVSSPETLRVARPGVPVMGLPEAAPMAAPARFAARKRNEALEPHLVALVERVFLPMSGEPTRCVAFASTDAETDSGPLTATAAEMLAERTTQSVCVVDANFRTPSLNGHFGLPSAAGLAEALALDAPLADCAQRIQRNLWVVPAGIATGRPSVASAAARQRMAQFVAQFDYVLVNVEPLAAGSDVAALLRLVGGVIVVVAAHSTRREAASRATQALAESGVTVIGAVLTS